MHGVPRDLDLSGFVGKALVQVCLGEFQVSFNFESGHLISVEGRWEVLDPQGVMLDHSRENAERDAYRVHRLLGRTVTAFALDPPSSFSMMFEDAYVLRVYDDSEAYESFSIQPGNLDV
jgi:hypothetical protein